MNVVIIEDEVMTAQDLSEILTRLPDNMVVKRILPTVAEALDYFRDEPEPDLIFSDIQLGDGHSFDIFRRIRPSCPVIFCTAYNDYALEAFRNNGIDYILKPFSRTSIEASVGRYKQLRDAVTRSNPDYNNLCNNYTNAENSRKPASLLVNWKDKIIPVKYSDIALFTIEYKMTQLITFQQQKYFISHTLEELEHLVGGNFFRANRQFLVNKDAIAEALQYFARKLVLRLKIEGKHEIIISKNKVPEFLGWLRQ